ncbi:hypothetical protein bcgnr5372_38220 [Bacillus luti]|nr:hypothetical protein [Bacillus cereus]HDR8327207.1 hypothetical protein [Bacillus cereus]HDR8336397.1 hypothetical protein [Bacillus cereus]
MITLPETTNKMITSLEKAAEKHNVSLAGITLNNFNSFLDDLFNDGGDIRCEQFADLSWSYAKQYGKFPGDAFMNANARAVEEAVKILEKKYPAPRKDNKPKQKGARKMATTKSTNKTITGARFDLIAIKSKEVPVGVESHSYGETLPEAVQDLIDTLERVKEGSAGNWDAKFYYTCEDDGFYIYTEEDMNYVSED